MVRWLYAGATWQRRQWTVEAGAPRSRVRIVTAAMGRMKVVDIAELPQGDRSAARGDVDGISSVAARAVRADGHGSLVVRRRDLAARWWTAEAGVPRSRYGSWTSRTAIWIGCSEQCVGGISSVAGEGRPR